VLPQFRARDRAQALFILATLKGYFTNFYPALLHCDKDRYIETWALVRCPRPFQTQGARQAVMQPTLVAHTCLSAAWCCTCCPTLMSHTPSFATSCTPATTAAQTLHPCYVAALTATPARFSFRVVVVRRRARSGGFDSRS
jgi:hypothetical protein